MVPRHVKDSSRKSRVVHVIKLLAPTEDLQEDMKRINYLLLSVMTAQLHITTGINVR